MCFILFFCEELNIDKTTKALKPLFMNCEIDFGARQSERKLKIRIIVLLFWHQGIPDSVQAT